MTAIAYIENVYKLYTNSIYGIEETIDLTFPNLCDTEFVVKPTEYASCEMTVVPNFCDITITFI